jgi:hypothetical protein
VVAKSANPSDAQLSDRDAFTIRYGRQSFHELEVVIDILRLWRVSVSEWGPAARVEKRKLTSSWKRPNARLKSPSSKSRRLLI